MLKKSFLSGLIFIVLSLMSAQAITFGASSQNITIRSDNADQVVQIAVFYHDDIQQIGWGDDSEAFFVTDVNAIWLRSATTTNIQAREFQGHARMSADSVTSANGEYRALTRRNNDIQIWSAHANTLITTLSGHTDTVNQIAFNPASTQLVSVSNDNTVRIWDIETAQSVQVWQTHSADVLSISYNPSGTQFVTASADGAIWVWNADKVQPIAILEGHDGAVNQVEFSPEGSVIASAGVDGTIRLWDATNFIEISVLENHTAPLTHLSFSPNGVYLLSASDDHTARLWAVVP